MEITKTGTTIFQEIATLSTEQRQLFELLLKKQNADLTQLPIPKRNSTDSIPLSYSQERVWTVAQLTPGSPVDNVPVGFHILGSFDASAFEQSVNLLIQRNEILRTLCSVQPQASQTVTPIATPWIQKIDLTHLPQGERLATAVEKATSIARLPFDLTQDGLFRVAIFTLDQAEFVVLLVAHQFVTDGLSFRLLLQELAESYRAILTGDRTYVAEPPAQYADFTIWQRQWFTDAVFKPQVEYWQKQLRGAPSRLKLPAYQSLQFPTYQGAYENIEFSAAHSNALRNLCRQQGVTTFMACIALFQSVLQHCTQQNDISIGTLTSNRNRREIERLVGNFSNNLLLRTVFSDDLTFSDVLGKVRETTLEAFQYQDVPFQYLLNAVEDVPTFQVLFILRNSTTAQSLDLPDLEIRDLPIDLGLTRMELSLDLTDDGKNPIAGKLEYKTELFEADTIRKIIHNFAALVEQVTANPQQKIADLQFPEVIPNLQLESPDLATNQPIQAPLTRSAQVATHDQADLPRTETEKTIATIWLEVLGLPHVGIHDNFFELGGNSLQAVRLFADIETRLGKKLPLATLLQSPTIAQLAEVAQQDEASLSWSPLVTIKAGDPHKIPLFCMHGGGFNVLVYRDLAMGLEPDQPVYGLQARGLDGTQFHDRLESMAADYIQEIRAIQPQGPYMLAGLSNGGNIAFEMAQQLHTQGEEVALLALFDSYGPNAVEFLPPIPRFFSALHYLVRFALPRYMGKVFTAESQSVLTKTRTSLTRAFSNVNQTSAKNGTFTQSNQPQLSAEEQAEVENSLLPKSHQPQEETSKLEQGLNRFSQYVLQHSPWSFFTPSTQLKDMDDELSATLKQLDKHYSKVQQAYQPKPYAGELLLFKAKEFPPGYRVNPKLGWGDLAKGGVKVSKIPGDHTSIMTSQVLVEKMQRCIKQATQAYQN